MQEFSGRKQNSLGGRKIEEKAKTRGANGEGQKVDAKMKHCLDDGPVEDYFCDAKDFYSKWGKYSNRKGIKMPFVPPFPKERPYRLVGWQPGLTPVQEFSPYICSRCSLYYYTGEDFL